MTLDGSNQTTAEFLLVLMWHTAVFENGRTFALHWFDFSIIHGILKQIWITHSLKKHDVR